MTAPINTNTAQAASLADNCMFVNLAISCWTARKFDKGVTEKVKEEHFASSDAGNFNKHLLGSEKLKAIHSYIAETRRLHMTMTLEGREKGYRLLTNQMYFKYRQVMQERKDGMLVLVESFKLDYPYLVDADRQRLGEMWNSSDYPDIEKLNSKFGFDLTIMPVPRGSDLKVVGLLDEDLRRLRDDIDQSLEERLAVAMKDAWTRLYDGLKRFTGKKIHAEETIKHLCELVEILPMLNVGNDPRLAELAQEVTASICIHDPGAIKDHAETRKEVVQSAKDILKEIESAMSGIFG